MALLVHSSAAAAVAAAITAQLADAIEAALPAALETYFSDLPTADPEVEGALWNDAGTVKVSAGE